MKKPLLEVEAARNIMLKCLVVNLRTKLTSGVASPVKLKSLKIFVGFECLVRCLNSNLEHHVQESPRIPQQCWNSNTLCLLRIPRPPHTLTIGHF